MDNKLWSQSFVDGSARSEAPGETEVLAGNDEVRNEVTIAPRDFSPIAAAEEDSRKFVRTARRPVRVRPSHVPVRGWGKG